MEKYESKQQQINRPGMDIYDTLSDFRRFTPIVQDKVEGWEATEDTCTFKVQGIALSLQMIEKVPGEYIKIGSPDGPLDFTFWVQLKEVTPYDTRMRIVLHAKLNMMMKMMIGGKIEKGINEIAEQMAKAFNMGL